MPEGWSGTPLPHIEARMAPLDIAETDRLRVRFDRRDMIDKGPVLCANS
jgi:hypothetical protein